MISRLLQGEDDSPAHDFFILSDTTDPEIFIAEVPGCTDTDLTPESVASHWGDITDRSTYDVPTQMGDEIAIYLKHLSD